MNEIFCSDHNLCLGCCMKTICLEHCVLSASTVTNAIFLKTIFSHVVNEIYSAKGKAPGIYNIEEKPHSRSNNSAKHP